MLLGIDIGTSSCKVTVFDEYGTVVSSVSRSYPVLYPGPGMAEQDPEEWWKAVCDAINCVIKNGVNPKDIKAIGTDGQSWSCIPVNKDGKVLANTPIWMDTRSREVCERLSDNIIQREIFDLSCNSFSPSYTTPKMLWFKRNRPKIFEKTWKFLQSNSFIVYRLTGEISQDYSQGYGIHFFDERNLCYNEKIAEKLGLSSDLVPDPVPCDRIVGQITEKVSVLTGLEKGTPVVAGGLDAACGALGSGVYKDGQTQEQGGQAGGMSICTSRCLSHKKLILGPHVVQGLWLLQGGSVAGGAALNWYSGIWGHGRSFAQLDNLASMIPAGSEGTVFLPYLSGERTPLWDPDAKGVFYGLDFSKTEGHLIRSVLEGVAFALKHNLDVAEETGLRVKTMNSIGGAANSRLWTQIKADVTGCTINVPYADEATTLGAALLSGVGCGIYKNYEEAVNATVKIKRQHTPDMKQHELYKKSFDIYMSLYPALKDVYKRQP